MILLDGLRRFFGSSGATPPLAPLAAGEGVVVAFSGGVDSTALLLALARLAPAAGWRVHAAHLDHALDPGSAGRAAAAARIAAAAGVPFESERRDVPALRRPGESAEAAARRVRYSYLEEARARAGARWVATAHHRGDQAETVLLRLLYGSGVEGLAGIRPVDGGVVRPLLDLPRADLEQAAADLATGLGLEITPLDDPTNRDLAVPRNRLRHRVLPALTAGGPGEPPIPDLEERLARLARRAEEARRAIDRRLEAELPAVPPPAADPGVEGSRQSAVRGRGAEGAQGLLRRGCEPAHGQRPQEAPYRWRAERTAGASPNRQSPSEARAGPEEEPLHALGEGGTTVRLRGAVRRADLARLPEPLLPFALAALHRRAGAPYPASRAARSELLRQLSREPEPAGCDCGAGWRWEVRGDLLLLLPPEGPLPRRRVSGAPPHGFTYTLAIPGEVEIPELSLGIRVHRAAVAPWMFSGSPWRVGLSLPLVAGDRVTVRSRRPGDRLSPLGAGGSRRLKELLIDRRVPRELRDSIPLLVVGGRIAWVPGVAIDERFRLQPSKGGEMGETGPESETAWVVEVISA